ncbi:Ribosomal RNA-processing protein 7 [Beauveria asiatica]|uniref:Ribosomal RNA-processing protein 7 n=1 Tax=Beauveria asiatica TaxID=1069075 RepID=A0AAW0S2J4_9HYPO
MALPKSCNDQFAVLSIQMPPCPSFPETAVHEVRIRRNAPKIATANDSRSLFLKNIPADSTEQHFRAVFTQLVGAGRFESIKFEDERGATHSFNPAQAVKINTIAKKRKRDEIEMEEQEKERQAMQLPEIWTRRVLRSSSTAVVLLADDKSVQLVLKAIAKANKTKKYPIWEDGSLSGVPPLGVPWISAHLRDSRVDKAAARRSVHAFFNAFNRKEKEAAELAKRLRNEPDEDGFVTVTRGGRTAPASKYEAEEAKRRMVEKDTKKKSEMKDFYRFQLRARRKEEQAALMRRFQHDREKVNAMREKRGKFKPES